KTVQTRLAVWLHERYGITPKIVNGETKAVASGSKKANLTRKGIITDFEAQPGFNLIIMSPLAAGVGLTVVGANHAIPLERHWNPAKEAQATDRIYRIGRRDPSMCTCRWRTIRLSVRSTSIWMPCCARRPTSKTQWWFRARSRTN